MSSVQKIDNLVCELKYIEKYIKWKDDKADSPKAKVIERKMFRDIKGVTKGRIVYAMLSGRRNNNKRLIKLQMEISIC